MKNKLLKLTMIVVIAIAVIWGMYKIYYSVGVDEDKDRHIYDNRNTILERIKKANNEIERNKIIDYYIREEIIDVY